jgi:hypothetical protein
MKIRGPLYLLVSMLSWLDLARRYSAERRYCGRRAGDFYRHWQWEMSFLAGGERP